MHHTALFPRFVVVGFVGTRHIGDPAGREALAGCETRLRDRLGEILDQLRADSDPKGSLIAVSSLAVGSDTAFAEAVSDREICHRVFLPQTPDAFFNLADFGSEEALKRSENRLRGGNVIDIRVSSDSPDRRERFSECGYEIADACEVLVAVHAEGAPKQPGGTLETLEFARNLGKRIIEIHLEGDMTAAETSADHTGEARLNPAQFKRLFTIELPDRPEADAYLPAVAALKRQTSSMSQRAKNFFQYSAAIVVTTHVAATLIAAAVLVYGIHQLWAIKVKLIFLAIGFGLPICLLLRKPQREWVTARLVAELCRSVLAMRGFRARLAYLTSFQLPDLDWLIQSLEILHLQAVPANRVGFRDFAKSYEESRVNVLIDFYETRAARAEMWHRVLESMFYGFSGAALVSAFAYFSIQEGWIGPLSGTEELAKIIPIGFPVMAAACAALISTLDLERRIERFRAMARFLEAQRECVRAATSETILARVVDRTEHALLQEIVEWFGKNTYVREP